MKMNSDLDAFTSADYGRNAHFPRREHGFSGHDMDAADPDIGKRRHTVELEQPRPLTGRGHGSHEPPVR